MTGFIHPNLVTTEAARRCTELHAEAERYRLAEQSQSTAHRPRWSGRPVLVVVAATALWLVVAQIRTAFL
jgi:hypothetical protein